MGEGRLSLGAGGRELLVLVEQPGAAPSVGHTGLYHFALLLPTRRDLARWLAHATREKLALTGLSDHFVSEAVYLSDPDGHGIEIYWDRPRTWESAGARPPPEGSAALRHLTIVLPERDELDRVAGRLRGAGVEIEVTEDGAIVRDPSANTILLRTA